jgi:flagellum-specific peptidoglycan hydrolase FlgJ
MQIIKQITLRVPKHNWRRSLSLVISIVTLLVFATNSTAAALSAKQKQLFDSGVSSFNIKDDAICSSSGDTSGGATGNGTVTTDMASFVDAYGQFAFNVGKANGIPYDAILAQASLESNYGQSKLTQQANNFFGIKAGANWTGQTVTFDTNEQTSTGAVYTVSAKFEAYPNAQAGFQGYADFLKRNQRYANVFNYQHNPVGYFQALKNDGYATDVAYVQKLTSRLSAVDQYIASKGVLTPEAQVVYDVQPTGGSTNGDTQTTQNGISCSVGASADGSGVVTIALGEIGNTYSKYTNGRQENWCADFVSWVYKSAGRPFTATSGVAMVDGWQIPAVASLMTYLQTKGQFFTKSQTATPPQPGDIVIYKNNMSHTNIVVEANGYMVKTVGGNQESNSFTTSVVSESKGAFDIRNDPNVTGWGRLP